MRVLIDLTQTAALAKECLGLASRPIEAQFRWNLDQDRFAVHERDQPLKLDASLAWQLQPPGGDDRPSDVRRF